MSHFSATLKSILAADPKASHETWAAHFGVYGPHLEMMLSGGGALGHRVIARIASHLSPSDRNKLVVAYFLDECDSIEREAAAVIPATIDWNLASGIGFKGKPHRTRKR